MQISSSLLAGALVAQVLDSGQASLWPWLGLAGVLVGAAGAASAVVVARLRRRLAPVKVRKQP